MSGDSPNAFTGENVFDFKGEHSTPAPTTSKEAQQGAGSVVQASVLVESPQEKRDEPEDRADFGAPTLHDEPVGRPEDGCGDNTTLAIADHCDGDDPKRDEQKLINGLDRLPNTRTKGSDCDEDEDKCLVNCIYYTMECCKCSII